MLKRLVQWRSPSGPDARLSVLIFHRVLPEPDPLFPDEVDARRFDELCGWIKSLFVVLKLDDAVNHLRNGTLPARAACITFDDGYADNLLIAAPILQNHGLSATFFVATGYLDGGCMWNDIIIESARRTQLRTWHLKDLAVDGLDSLDVETVVQKRTAIQSVIGQLKYLPSAERGAVVEEVASHAKVQVPHDLMMTSGDVKRLRDAGMTIGAHTVTHPILASLNDVDASEEIVGSKLALEKLLDQRVGLFAYPNGKRGIDFSDATVGIVRGLGFDAAVTTDWASSGPGTDLFQIPRFTPWDKSRLRFGARLIANL